MKAQEHFDELARRKLAQRSLPFEASDWQDMERLLHARRRRRAAGWWSTGALLFVLAGAAWWAWSPSQESTGQVSQLGTTAAAGNDKTPEPKTVLNTNTTQRAAEKEEAPGPDGKPSGAGTALHPSSRTVARPAATQPPPREHIRSDQPDAHSTAPAVSFTMLPHVETTLSPTVENSAGTEKEPAGTISPTAPAIGNALPPEEKPGDVTPIPPTELPVVTTAVVENAPPEDDAAPPTGNAPDTVPGMPPSLPAAAPAWSLEAHVLGGALRTRPQYGNAEYDDHSTAGITPSFGAELRWGGAHFGFGGGLHYASYSDRIQLDELSKTNTSFPVTYNFIAVDTAVMTVIDTVVQGGITYYVTQQVNTTILVLDPDVDTVTTTTVTREQFDRVNTVSYLELPLFFDARTATGRWTFGVCAGPTLGFLVGHQGALPGATPGTSIEFEDQTFHSVQFGYAARVYARYGLNDRWSVGLEPAIRGYFGNEFKEGDLSRTSSGYGVLLSVGCVLH